MRKLKDSERKEFEEDFKLARPIKPKAVARSAKKPGGSGGLGSSLKRAARSCPADHRPE